MAEDRFVAHGLLMVGDRVLLLRRRAGRYLGEQWDIPGGTVERGETSAEAVVRECAEETGLAAQVGAELAHYSNLDTEGRDIVFHTLTYELRAAWTGDQYQDNDEARHHDQQSAAVFPGEPHRQDSRRNLNPRDGTGTRNDWLRSHRTG